MATHVAELLGASVEAAIIAAQDTGRVDGR
jgi:hypothetical protein